MKNHTHKVSPVVLTAAEWKEIVADLKTKRNIVGGASFANNPLARRWRRAIDLLVGKLGEEGEIAARYGVSPVQDEEDPEPTAVRENIVMA